MRAIGYLVLINNAYPETIAFDKNEAMEIAKRFNPKAMKLINRKCNERQSASELAKILAHDNTETREDILHRVRTGIDNFFKEKHSA